MREVFTSRIFYPMLICCFVLIETVALVKKVDGAILAALINLCLIRQRVLQAIG